MQANWTFVEETTSYLHNTGRAVVWQSVLDWQWYGYWTLVDPVGANFDYRTHKVGPVATLSQACEIAGEAAEGHSYKAQVARSHAMKIRQRAERVANEEAQSSASDQERHLLASA